MRLAPQDVVKINLKTKCRPLSKAGFFYHYHDMVMLEKTLMVFCTIKLTGVVYNFEQICTDQ